MKNKRFLRLGLYLFLGLIVSVFFSCNKDDDDLNYSTITEIKATNVKIENNQIATVNLCVYDKDNYGVTVSETDYINDGFTLKLPESIDSEHLYLLSRWVGKKSIVSDENAKISDAYICCNDENNRRIYTIQYGNFSDKKEYNVWWMYSDRDVTVKGKITRGDDGDGVEEIEEFDFKLKKGWNVVYGLFYIKSKGGIDSYISLVTNKKHSGIDLSWSIEHWYD